MVLFLLAAGTSPAQAAQAPAYAPGRAPVPDAVSDLGGSPRPDPNAKEGPNVDAQRTEAARTGQPVEVPALRTSSSSTFVRPDGAFETRSSGAPVNYRDASGQWQPIDATLKPAATGGGWHGDFGGFTVDFPAALDAGPVRIAKGAISASFAVPGATGTGVVSGNQIRYPSVAPGVSVTYVVSSSGLSERFELATSKATAVLPGTITTNAGTTVRNDTGAWTLTNGADSLSIPRPWARDGRPGDTSGLGLPGTTPAVSLQLTPTGPTAWTATTTVDPTWLAAPERVFPVTVDPSFTVSGTGVADCMIGPSYSTNYCGYGFDVIGVDGFGQPLRSLLQPDLSALPLDAVVVDATISTQIWGNTATAKTIEARQVSTKWNTANVTWTNKDNATATAWGTAGGEFATTGPTGPEQSGTVGATSGVWIVKIARMTQAWAADPIRAPFGVILKAAAGQESGAQSLLAVYSSEDATSSNRPLTTVVWTPRQGEQRFEQFWSQNLNDQAQVKVNLATGSLLVHSHDLTEKGVADVDMTVDRYYNSRAHAVGGLVGLGAPNIGNGWVLGTGNGLAIIPLYSGFTLAGTQGELATFQADPGSSTYTSPGQNAQLTVVAGSPRKYKVWYHDTGTTYLFRDTSAGAPYGYGVLESVTDRNGNATTATIGASPDYKISKLTDPYGTDMTFNRNVGTGRMSGVTLSTGRSVSYSVDNTNNRLDSYTDASGNTTNYTYFAGSGLLQYIDTPQSASATYRVEFTYDGNGRVSTVKTFTSKNGAGTVTSYTTGFTYTAPTTGALPTGASEVNVTNARSKVFKYQSDGNLRVGWTTDPLGHVSKTVRNANGDATEAFKDGITNPTSYGYNTTVKTNLEQAMNPNGAKESWTYYGGTTTDPRSYQPISYKSQNANGATSPANTEVYSTDANGNRDQTANSAGVVFTKTKLHNVVNSDGSTYTCTNAKPGQVCSTTVNPAGLNQTTAFAYTAGRVTTITPPAAAHPSPATGATTLTYDSDGRITKVLDGKGQYTCNTYDSYDRVLTQRFGASSSCTGGSLTTYTFDKAGNMTQRVDPVDTTVYTYDGLHRPTAKSIGGTQVNSAGYDATSNLTSYITDEGSTGYVYNDDNLPTGLFPSNVSGANCGVTPSHCTTISYKTSDQLLRITFPSGAYQEWDPDDSGRPDHMVAKEAGGTTVADLQYSYLGTGGANDGGNIRSVVSGGVTTTYNYDAANRDRLLNRTPSSGTIYSYTYDVNGNRLTSSNGATTTYYKYDAQNRLCTTSTTSAPVSCPTSSYPYTYDANGNQLTGGGHTQTYNTRNQTTTSDGDSYFYMDGGQAQRTETDNYYFDNWLLGSNSISPVSGTGTYYGRLPNGLLVYTSVGTSASNLKYFVHDGEKNVINLINNAGTKSATYTYDPYGNNASATGTDAAKTKYRYKAGWLDDNGLYKYGDRYYSPGDARWTQPDPIPTSNLYNYVDGDPINRWDPTGRFSLKDIATGVGIGTGAVLAIASAPVSVPTAVLVAGAVGAGVGTGFFVGCGVQPTEPDFC